MSTLDNPALFVDRDLIARRQKLGDPQRLLDAYANGWSDGQYHRGSRPGGLPDQERRWYDNGYQDGQLFKRVLVK